MNRALVRLLVDRDPELRERGIEWRITGVASRRLGWIANRVGFDPGLLSPEQNVLSENFPEALRQSAMCANGWLLRAPMCCSRRLR